MKKSLAYTACGLAVGGMAAAYLHGAVADARYAHEMEKEYAARMPRAFPDVLKDVLGQDLENGHYPRWLLRRAAKRLGL